MPLDDTNAMPDPLVDLSLTGATGPGGTIRVRASDFLVDEIPLYDPCGSGEHLYLGIQKEGMPITRWCPCCAGTSAWASARSAMRE
jgi:hypothetical protein